MSNMLRGSGFMSAADMFEETRPIPKAKPAEDSNTEQSKSKVGGICARCKRYRTLAPNFWFCVTCSALMARGTEQKERLDALGLGLYEAYEKVAFWERIPKKMSVKLMTKQQ